MKHVSWVLTWTASLICSGGWQPSLCQSVNGPAAATGTKTVEVAPGALETERKGISRMIDEASQHGAGTDSYRSLFTDIEGKARSGASQQELEPLVKRLSDALQDQKRRAESAKSQPSASASKNLSSTAFKGQHQSSNASSSGDVAAQNREAIVARREALLEEYKEGKISQSEMEREISKDGLPLAQRTFRSKGQAEMWARRQMMMGRNVTLKKVTLRRQ